MTNMYVFWKLTDDPPSPWTRVTRTNKYLRFDSDPSKHWGDAGNTTHDHSLTSYECDDGTPCETIYNTLGDLETILCHQHTFSSWGISSGNNGPPGYGLDIIKTDLAEWETNQHGFPEGALILSNGMLVDASLSRFSAADGKYIVHGSPGSTWGDTAHNHYITATGSTTSALKDNRPADGALAGFNTYEASAHSHDINVIIGFDVVDPRSLVTRLYEVVTTASKAIANTVVFVDGTPGSNWEILTGWSGANLKIGNSNPTLSGSDVHTHSTQLNTTSYTSPRSVKSRLWQSNPSCYVTHRHRVTVNLSSACLVPKSKYVIPARLKTDLGKRNNNHAQIIGLW